MKVDFEKSKINTEKVENNVWQKEEDSAELDKTTF
jgi:hypothetical protein